MQNLQKLKSKNISDVLYVMHTKKSSTKNAIAKELNLSTVTVHNIVNDLLNVGICEEAGERISSGGRNAVVYKINEDYKFIIGLRLDREHITTRVYDIGLNLKYENKVNSSLQNIDHCIETACEEIHKALDAGFNSDRCLGIGVTIPGRASKHENIVQIPGCPNCSNFPLARELQKGLDAEIPIVVDNDNNACALAEKWKGDAFDFHSYVYISLERGVGTGVVLDDSLFYGTNYNACEIGHIPILPRGPKCRCGKRGCIETLASDEAVFNAVANEIQLQYGVTPENWEQIFEMSQKQQFSNIDSIIKEKSYYVILLLEMIIQSYDPAAVILQSEWMPKFSQIWKEVVAQVFADCQWLRRDRFTLTLSEGRNVLDASAASLVMEKAFADFQK